MSLYWMEKVTQVNPRKKQDLISKQLKLTNKNIADFISNSPTSIDKISLWIHGYFWSPHNKHWSRTVQKWNKNMIKIKRNQHLKLKTKKVRKKAYHSQRLQTWWWGQSSNIKIWRQLVLILNCPNIRLKYN